jgi:hypothetical protein
MPTAARAQVAYVRVNAKPVTVKMCVPTVCAQHMPHLESEDCGDHVVDSIEFIDVGASTRELLADNAHSPKGLINNLLAVRRDPGVYMDATIEGLLGRIVDWWNGAP